jgi:hypothetical protein
MILLPAAALAFPASCRAANMVKVDKTKIRVSLAAGQETAGVINLENPSKDVLGVRMYMEDWTYVAPFDGSKEFKPVGNSKASAAPMITFTPSELTLGPFAKGKLNYTVKVPEGAQGGYRTAIFFESANPASANEGVGVNVSLRVAVIFFVEAEGTVNRQIEIKDMSVTRKSQKDLLKLTVGVKNTCNTDLTVGGNYNIMNDKGMIAARGELSNTYTLPGDSGKVEASWSLPITPGDYTLVLTLDIGKAIEEAGMGRGPVILKEASLKIGADGSIAGIGELK